MAQDHPRLIVKASDRDAVVQKTKHTAWAADAVQRMHAEVDRYVDRHKTDPDWIVSRLAMYWREGEHYTQCYLQNERWERGEGNAPVPTVRMPGMRTWNQYKNVALEERTPYNETGDMWGLSRTDPTKPKVLVPYKESGHMIRSNNVEILTLAEQAAFLYWLTGDEAYARFAADIFYPWLVGTYYMQPILDPGRSSKGPGGWEPGGILGYYDYEQIHDDLALHAAVVYDFCYDYLHAHPYAPLTDTEKGLREMASTVFKRFIDIGMVRGGKSGNWNVNGWNMMLKPILVLDDDSCYADGHGRQYYLRHLTSESTQWHDAIPDILRSYDKVTGLWPESPGYAFGTINMLCSFATLLRGEGIDIIADNPIMERAALAVLPWTDARGNIIVFGDTRGGAANYQGLEQLLAYYTAKGDAEAARQVAAAIRRGIDNGSYQRENTGWEGICTYVDNIAASAATAMRSSSYSPFHRVAVMKNGADQMAVVYGGRNGSHLSPNGLALQLYGQGYALAPDAAAYESYWSADKTYHQSPTGSNTILPGYAEGDVTVNIMEPQVAESQFESTASYSPYVSMTDMSAAEKRRLVAMIQTENGAGYYVDIFRSNLPSNDYLMHHVGRSLSLTDTADNPLLCVAVDSVDHPLHKGYAWFKELGMARWNKPLKATWTVAEGADAMATTLWMTGAEGRQIYTASAPYTTLDGTLTPGGVSAAPGTTPTLLVRQSGNNAWEKPFMSVVETTSGSEQPVVRRVEEVVGNGHSAVVAVSTSDGSTDYICTSTEETHRVEARENVAVTGLFGMARMAQRKPRMLTMAGATSIKAGRYAITAVEPCAASIYEVDGQWRYSASKPVTISLNNKKYHLSAAQNEVVK